MYIDTSIRLHDPFNINCYESLMILKAYSLFDIDMSGNDKSNVKLICGCLYLC